MLGAPFIRGLIPWAYRCICIFLPPHWRWISLFVSSPSLVAISPVAYPFARLPPLLIATQELIYIQSWCLGRSSTDQLQENISSQPCTRQGARLLVASLSWSRELLLVFLCTAACWPSESALLCWLSHHLNGKKVEATGRKECNRLGLFSGTQGEEGSRQPSHRMLRKNFGLFTKIVQNPPPLCPVGYSPSAVCSKILRLQLTSLQLLFPSFLPRLIFSCLINVGMRAKSRKWFPGAPGSPRNRLEVGRECCTWLAPSAWARGQLPVTYIRYACSYLARLLIKLSSTYVAPHPLLRCCCPSDLRLWAKALFPFEKEPVLLGVEWNRPPQLDC